MARDSLHAEDLDPVSTAYLAIDNSQDEWTDLLKIRKIDRKRDLRVPSLQIKTHYP